MDRGGNYNNFSVPPPNYQQMPPKSGGFNEPPPSYNKPGGYDSGNRGGGSWNDGGNQRGGGYGNGGGSKDNYNKGGYGNNNSGGAGGYGSSGSNDMVTQEDTIFVSGMNPSATERDIETHFGAIGIIKKDKRTMKPKIWLYRHKDSGESKGEATVTYDDTSAAQSAITWFDGRDFNGCIIKVSLAQRANTWNKGGRGGGRGGRGGGGGGGGNRFDRGGDFGGDSGPRGSYGDSGPRGGGGSGGGRGARMGSGGGGGSGDQGRANNVQHRDGDWKCSSCNNTNFAWRNECNRCKAPKDRQGGGGGGFNDGGSDNSGAGGGDYFQNRGGNRGGNSGGGFSRGGGRPMRNDSGYGGNRQRPY